MGVQLKNRRIAAPIAAATLILTGLTACSTGSTATTATTGGTGSDRTTTLVDPDAFPVTIAHAFGETTIESEPTRVATLGWTDQDNALALGVVPVGATKLTWGGNEGGSSDWFDEELAEEFPDATAPVRYDDADGVPVEEVAKLTPDLILATNSGITEAEYAKLSKIAPVVAYPDAPWVTPWQTSLETVGKALGRTALAAEVKQAADEEIAEVAEDFPQLHGTSFIMAYLATTDLSQIGVYGPQDPRVAILEDFGLVIPDTVHELVKDGEFYASISAERAASLESDILLTYGETAGDLDTFAADRLVGQIPALKAGRAYAEVDKHVGLAITNPTPISIPFIVEQFLPHVAKAATGQ